MAIIPYFAILDCQQYVAPDGFGLQLKKNVYCTAEDDQRNYENKNNLLNALLQHLQEKPLQELWISTFDISEKKIIDFLCQRLRSNNLKLKLVMSESENTIDVQMLASCTAGKSTFELAALPAGQNGLKLHHAKMILINPQQEDGVVIAGSANLTSGTHSKHENLFVFKNNDKKFFEKHKCAFNELMQFKSIKTLKEKHHDCARKYSTNNPRVFLVPGEGEKLLEFIAQKLQFAKNASIASHRYSLNPLHHHLVQFLKRSGNLTIYLDSGYMEAFFHQVSFQSELELLNFFELSGLGAKIVPIYTNQPHGSFFHHKLLVMDQAYNNDKPIIVVGSANFTHAAFLSTEYNLNEVSSNTENIYLIKSQDLYNKTMDFLARFNPTKLSADMRTPPYFLALFSR